MKKSLTTDPLSPLYVPNTPENSNIDILQNYINIFKDVLGNGVDLRGSRFSNLNEINRVGGIKTIVDRTKNDNYIYYIGEKRNYSHAEQKTYQSTKDYVYSLSTSVDANASFPVQMATVSVETHVRTGLDINENTDIMNLTFSVYNENAQIDLNQLNFFDKTITPISQNFLDDLDNLIDNHLEIDNVEDFNSWTEYEQFFKDYGTHAISSLILGSKMDIYYSSEKYSYSKISDLKVSACVNVEMFNNILENYKSTRSGRLGDIIDDDYIENTFDWNSLDSPDEETCSMKRDGSKLSSKGYILGENSDSTCSHMTPRPNDAKIPVTYPPESTRPPKNPEINVGLCAGVTTEEKNTSTKTNINSRINILGGDPTINSRLVSIFGDGSALASTDPGIIKNNIDLVASFLASADTTPGVMDTTYIPIWEFVSNLFSISDIETYYGIKRFQRFINNLINYFSFSAEYTKDSGVAFYKLTPDKDTPVGYILHNEAAPNDYALGATNIWTNGEGSSADGAPFNFRPYNHVSPAHYNWSIYRDGGYKCDSSDYDVQGSFWNQSCCSGGVGGKPGCDRGFDHRGECGCRCYAWDDQKVMFTAATQQLIFYGNPLVPEENVITIAKIRNENYYMSIGNEFDGNAEISKQAIFGVNKSKEEVFKDKKCIWKIDFTGRIRNILNPNLCLEWQTNNEIWLKTINENNPAQKFYLVKCDYIKASDYPYK